MGGQCIVHCPALLSCTASISHPVRVATTFLTSMKEETEEASEEASEEDTWEEAMEEENGIMEMIIQEASNRLSRLMTMTGIKL